MRDTLPCQQKKEDVNIWAILKSCIGKDLTKITMPIQFNEPLSFLQRMAESLEYSYLLADADEEDDPIARMENVAAFAISAGAYNWDRMMKPFNPLLGETYELQRDGFKLVAEQVSHHPPISAFHAEHKNYIFSGSMLPKMKFYGKSVEIIPKGVMTVVLSRHGEAYTWSNVPCCVHNVIVGKLWIEQYGTMEITCHRTGYKAQITFKPSGWFSRDVHKIEGFILDQKCV
ncbi:unnamed protein product [Darwinula stevensoni]|uniref:Oxysterol-binding protein n=1 Tax=Darwinula stevensoni TaxID=69355 RepID=A0A7R8X1J5_9CRUS|nr:unnamed protein product [Darwinula stevensoni]CAG0880371.1 unnamed protein product [Darwinula stevensoni]